MLVLWFLFKFTVGAFSEHVNSVFVSLVNFAYILVCYLL